MNKNTKNSRPAKALKITFSPSPAGMPCLVFIARGDTACDYERAKADRQSTYWVSRLLSEWGIAARFAKGWGDGPTADFADERYDVLIDGSRSQCECKGFLRHGHCKHVEALRQLIEANALPLSPRPEHAEEIPGRLGISEAVLADVLAMPCGLRKKIGEHDVERVAVGWFVDDSFASSENRLRALFGVEHRPARAVSSVVEFDDP